MTGRLAHIIRHPVKSIGWEELSSVRLTTGETLPGDRRWAVAHEAAAFEGDPEEWQAKRNFVRGVAGPQLMAIRAELSEDGTRVSLRHHQRPDIEIMPDVVADSARLVDWLEPLWPENRPAAARIVHCQGQQALTDVPDPFISILSLSSLRAFGQMAGRDLSIHRFRGNLWLDGFAPWEEVDMIGRELMVGSVRFRVEERITRCNATKVDPNTGRPDIDTLGLLEERFDHRDFGVYATVLEGGDLTTGDEASLT